MLKVALTGGLATGKTHVLTRFAELGVRTIDADRLVHEALRRGSTVNEAVARRFGPGVITAEGDVDRKKLGALVFADPAARHDLEGILHPLVYTAIARWFETLAAEDRHPLAIADIPLLYETGRDSMFDRVIVVACDPEEQVRRAMARDGMAETEARQRMAAQLPIGDKVRRADVVIWTDGSIERTNQQVEDVYRGLRAES